MPDIKVKGYSGNEFEYENVEKVWLTSAKESAKETLLAEQEMEFEVADQDEDGTVVYATSLSTVLDIATEETIIFSWDGVEYTCKAISVGDGFIAAGNLSIMNAGEDSGEPFVLLLALAYSETAIGTLSTDSTHTVAIYKGSTGVALVPFTYGELLAGVEITPDFSTGDQQISVPDGSLVKEATILKPDTLLPENIVKGVEIAGVVGDYVPDTEEVTVELDMADGDQTIEPSEGKLLSKATVKKPETLVSENILQGVDIGGVVGSAVPEPETEEATVTLDFSGGDMVVEPTEGKLLSKVDIPKPDTLIPENIAKDVMIAGILGTHEGEGGGVESKFAVKSGSFKATVDGVQTITHELGVPPEIMFLYTSSTPGTSGIICLNGYCEKIKAEQVVELNTSSGSMFISFTFGVDNDSYSYGQFKNVNPVTFDVGGGTAQITTGITYYWTVIGGVVPGNDWIILHLELDGNGNIIVTGGVPEIETLEVFLDGVSVGTVDYAYGDSTTIDISTYVTKATEYSVTVQANGTAIDGKYVNQYCYPVTGYVIEPSITASGSCGINATWTLDEAGRLFISGTGDIKDYTKGGSPWYSNRASIKSITVESGITRVGNYAFELCQKAVSISLPLTCTSIGNYSFKACSSLTSFNIPRGITTIGQYAFYNCTKLASVLIPKNVTSIQYGAFESCSKLTSATFEDTEGWYIARSSTATSGTDLSSSNLASTSTAASYLRGTYLYYYWFRK